MATVRLRAPGQNGNPLPWCVEPVALPVTGLLERIGPAGLGFTVRQAGEA